MARSLLDAPFDVLMEQAGNTLIHLEEPTWREAFVAVGFPLVERERELKAALDEMMRRRWQHKGFGRVGGGGRLGADQGDRVRWAARAGAWVKVLRKQLQLAALQGGPEVPIRAVRDAMAEHQRTFPGILRDLRSVVRVLRAQDELVPFLGLPNPLIDGEALLAEGERLDPVLTASRADALRCRREAEAARRRVIELLRMIRAAWLMADLRFPGIPAMPLRALEGWSDGSGRESKRKKRPRREKSPSSMADSPTDLSDSPTPLPDSPSPLPESPTGPSGSSSGLSDSPTPLPDSPTKV